MVNKYIAFQVTTVIAHSCMYRRK